MAAIVFDAGEGEVAFDSGEWVFKMAPMIYRAVPIPIAEMKNESFRPKVSTPKNKKSAVAINLTTPFQD